MFPLNFLRMFKRPPGKKPPPKNFVDLFWDADNARLVVQFDDGTTAPVSDEGGGGSGDAGPGDIEQVTGTKTITAADHGKSLKFSGNMTVALSNPGKAVRFTAVIFKTSDVARTITISCSNVAFVFDGSGTYPPDDYAGPWSPGPSPIVLPILGGDPVDQVVMYEFEFIGNVWRITTLFEQNIP